MIYGVRLLQALKDLPVETHLVMTRTAEITLAHETTLKVAEVRRLADTAYRIEHGATIMPMVRNEPLEMAAARSSMP